jgi:hypothetical protein
MRSWLSRLSLHLGQWQEFTQSRDRGESVVGVRGPFCICRPKSPERREVTPLAWPGREQASRPRGGCRQVAWGGGRRRAGLEWWPLSSAVQGGVPIKRAYGPLTPRPAVPRPRHHRARYQGQAARSGCCGSGPFRPFALLVVARAVRMRLYPNRAPGCSCGLSRSAQPRRRPTARTAGGPRPGGTGAAAVLLVALRAASRSWRSAGSGRRAAAQRPRSGGGRGCSPPCSRPSPRLAREALRATLGARAAIINKVGRRSA